jgi:hypothetical protein
MDVVDYDKSGELDRDEFLNLMRLVGGQTIARVVIMVCIMVAVPFLSLNIVESLAGTFQLKSLMASCPFVAVSSALPFLTKQTAATVLSGFIVFGLVPWMFEVVDNMLLGGRKEKAHQGDVKTEESTDVHLKKDM